MDDKQRIVIRHTVEREVAQACDYLASLSGLSKGRVKDAMNKGAVWHTGRKGKRRRLRRATASVAAGETLELFYDAALLALRPAAAQLIDDRRRYSVWCKPARVMAQGTDYGDHCSLLRQAELHFKPARAAYPVHRLDREASGLMLVAHDAEAAARLSALFRDNQIEKLYGVRVRGAAPQERGTIDLPLDDKPALTHYIVRDYDGTHDISTLEVRIESGRLHQIRRHLALIDLPVLGDPRYGTGNKNTEGLQLQAISLEFICPYSGEKRSYQLR